MTRLTVCKKVDTSDAMEGWGRQLAQACLENELTSLIIVLQGSLGAGKTTFVRGFLRGFDHFGSVKSPTYTLVEPYTLAKGQVMHFDFYRLNEPEALEDIGIRDYISDAFCLIEWPDKAGSLLPSVDIQLNIEIEANGRQLTFEAISQRGKDVVSACCVSKTDPDRL